MKRSATMFAAVLAAGFLLGLTLGSANGVRAAKPAAPDGSLPLKDARLLAEVLERVEREYVDSLNDHDLLQAAVRGMVNSLDPYSEFLDDQEFEEIQISSSGEYSGVGIEVAMQDAEAVVVTPLDGGSAAKAGVRAGDVIVSIDGVPVSGGSLNEVIRRMRGNEGTAVKVSFEREGVAEPIEFNLKRARIELHSVRAQLVEPGYAYARISQFSETTGEDLKRELKAAVARNGGRTLKGLVLDLRNNPGGVLEAAVAVADEFLDKGVIVTAEGRTPESKFEMDATPGDELNGAPIVVMVNGGSASAAEIVAAALHDNHRARLLGRKTFGKGLVQTVIPLSEGRALKLTTSRYFTPSGESINHKGIVPDVVLERASAAEPIIGEAPSPENDVELARALAELKSMPDIKNKNGPATRI